MVIGNYELVVERGRRQWPSFTVICGNNWIFVCSKILARVKSAVALDWDSQRVHNGSEVQDESSNHEITGRTAATQRRCAGIQFKALYQHRKNYSWKLFGDQRKVNIKWINDPSERPKQGKYMNLDLILVGFDRFSIRMCWKWVRIDVGLVSSVPLAPDMQGRVTRLKRQNCCHTQRCTRARTLQWNFSMVGLDKTITLLKPICKARWVVSVPITAFVWILILVMVSKFENSSFWLPVC